MEDFHAAGGIPAVLRELRHLLHLDCRHRDRRDARRAHRGGRRPGSTAPIIRPFARTGARRRRPRRAVRQSGAARRDPQALGGRSRRCSSAKAARSSSTSLEDLAARIDDPDLDVAPDDFLVLQERRPDERRGDAGGRLSADPGKARQGRRQGHGAHLRRAHERHRLRHDRAPRRARRGFRRPAGAGAQAATASASASPGVRLDLLVDDAELARRRARLVRPAIAPRRAAISGSTTSRSCRPTKVATSHFYALSKM